MSHTLDNIDIKILKELQQNGKMTTKELANRVGLSQSPVFERQRKLEQEGYIVGYAAILSPQKTGNNIQVWCNIKLKKHAQEMGQDFMSKIVDFDEVVECYNTSGDYDFMVKILVHDMSEYQNFVLNKLGTIDSIGSLDSVFVLGVVKQTPALPLKNIDE